MLHNMQYRGTGVTSIRRSLSPVATPPPSARPFCAFCVLSPDVRTVQKNGSKAVYFPRQNRFGYGTDTIHTRFMQHTILIVDDDTSVLASLSLLLKQAGWQSRAVTSPREALAALRREHISLVLQDMNFSRRTSGEEGLALLREIRTEFPTVPVVLLTAWGSIALAVRGMQSGAADFITKPWTNDQVVQSITTALGIAAAATHEQALTRDDLDMRYDFTNIIGRDPQLLKILDVIGRISATGAPVLITGESGTGKELIADAVHRNSPRRDSPFVKVNLGSITPTLFESELFGHVRGAFTDARTDRKGRFELADTGTIFLDEIGDIDFSCQVKLLRVLQNRTFEPVGSSLSRTVDVRVVSATNRNLATMIEQQNFREDLLYRLNLISVHLPSLRERRSDIPLLASHFLHQTAHVYNRHGITVSADGMKWLEGRNWPGNIRELKHLIERTVLITTGSVLTADDFVTALTIQSGESRKDFLPAVGSMTIEEMEKAMIVKAVEHYDGNVSRIAEALGLSRAALYRRFEKYGISV